MRLLKKCIYTFVDYWDVLELFKLTNHNTQMPFQLRQQGFHNIIQCLAQQHFSAAYNGQALEHHRAWVDASVLLHCRPRLKRCNVPIPYWLELAHATISTHVHVKTLVSGAIDSSFTQTLAQHWTTKDAACHHWSWHLLQKYDLTPGKPLSAHMSSSADFDCWHDVGILS